MMAGVVGELCDEDSGDNAPGRQRADTDPGPSTVNFLNELKGLTLDDDIADTSGCKSGGVTPEDESLGAWAAHSPSQKSTPEEKLHCFGESWGVLEHTEPEKEWDPEKERPKCPKGHTLVEHVNTESFSNFCNRCKREDIRAPERIFRCKRCDFDLCQKCYAQSLDERVIEAGSQPGGYRQDWDCSYNDNQYNSPYQGWPGAQVSSAMMSQGYTLPEPAAPGALPPGVWMMQEVPCSWQPQLGPVAYGNDQSETARRLAAAALSAAEGPSYSQVEWNNVYTVMMRNLPNKVTQDLLVSEINDAGFLDYYDFVYLPIDPETSANRGYAFINFVMPGLAFMFKIHFEGRRFVNFNSHKVVSVVPAALQGFDANYARYPKARVTRSAESSSTRTRRGNKHKTESLIDIAARQLKDEKHSKRKHQSKDRDPKDEQSNDDESHQESQLESPAGEASTTTERAADCPEKQEEEPQSRPAEQSQDSGSASGAPEEGLETPQLTVKFCPYCGGSCAADFKFCLYCGSAIPSTSGLQFRQT
jgi:hypothetical protein